MADKNLQKKSEENLEQLLKNGDKLLKDLKDYFNEGLDNITKDIEALYGRFSEQNNISKNEAMALIQGDEYKRWKMSMEEYLKKIDMTGDNALLLELNTLAMRKRINRLEALQAELTANMSILAQNEEKYITELLSNSLEESYYKSMYEEYLMKEPKALELLENNNVKLSRGQLTNALTYPWSGSTYKELIWDNAFVLTKKTKKIIAQNILSGKSISKLTDELAKTFMNGNKLNAERLIRTELAYIKGQADVLVYDKLEVKKYRILATLDNRTSPTCQKEDGNVYNIKDIKVGVNYPPFHTWCRTTTIKYREDDDKRTRLARDKNGKNVKVPLNMKYKDWLEWVNKEK